MEERVTVDRPEAMAWLVLRHDSSCRPACRLSKASPPSSRGCRFELLTTENFPRVMLPAFQCNPASALFFVAFIVIGIFLLLTLTLGECLRGCLGARRPMRRTPYAPSQP